MLMIFTVLSASNREYLAPQIRSMNNRFHSEAKVPWSYDYPLANHIATNKSSANGEMPLFPRLYPSFGYLRKIFAPRGLKILPIGIKANQKFSRKSLLQDCMKSLHVYTMN